ncbi:MAG: SET domain-containing protein [Ktedonobacterales bacterium]
MDGAKGQIPEHTWLDPRIALRASPRGGYGLFASAPIRAGENVLVWGGASYTDEAGAQEAVRAGKAVMQWDAGVYSVATDDDDSAFKINHGCDPNVWMQDAFRLVARRDIAAGDELLADYALWECHCGSALCRTRITGRDWRLLDLRERYRGHFSPVLEGRIARLPASAQEARPSTNREGYGDIGDHC